MRLISGTLVIDTTNFDAQIGDQFDIITATNGFTGSFNDVQGVSFGNGKALELVETDTQTMSLRVVSEASPVQMPTEFEYM